MRTVHTVKRERRTHVEVSLGADLREVARGEGQYCLPSHAPSAPKLAACTTKSCHGTVRHAGERAATRKAKTTHLEADLGAGSLGVVDGLGARLDVLGHLVVVRRREDGQVGEAVERDGVGRRRVAEAERVARDGARRDRVGRLGTEEEPVAANDLLSARVRVSWSASER